MWNRDRRHLLPLAGSIFILVFIGFGLYDRKLTTAVPFQTIRPSSTPISTPSHTSGQHAIPLQGNPPAAAFDVAEHYTEVFSVSTKDKKYFEIDFAGHGAINPNIIPHPVFNKTWILVAQQFNHRVVPNSVWNAELTCNGVFKDGALRCDDSPLILPIASTIGGKCPGKTAYMDWNVGPHDARVFYGPKMPYAIFGSNSGFTCFGQWIQDMRVLVDWGLDTYLKQEFHKATELQRPAPYGLIEKNWFVFWDNNEQMYAHYDLGLKRVFARVDGNGSIGEDLAPLAAASDKGCLAKYVPKSIEGLESIHQATNSLAISLCKRADACVPNDSNTFILTIFHHKTFYYFHSVYEPYVMLFQQKAPFAIHAISKKPIWIHGRGGPGQGTKPPGLPADLASAWNQTEMFYVTSLSWKTQGQKYHGFVDDVMFMSFGIEDSRTAGIDITAGDLLKDMGLC
ncbi:hypothetical protein BP5796_08336 [Coleophoma crateriformis]|uniref:Uncharacterized protein n=1 Tax=Coleophoma crateriformis TaxID=565419 RepID=A0A3D8R7B7_9HELO|nr:hypothetical protein BP5796_08336 [Coleophoma crateriformis]